MSIFLRQRHPWSLRHHPWQQIRTSETFLAPHSTSSRLEQARVTAARLLLSILTVSRPKIAEERMLLLFPIALQYFSHRLLVYRGMTKVLASIQWTIHYLKLNVHLSIPCEIRRQLHGYPLSRHQLWPHIGAAYIRIWLRFDRRMDEMCPCTKLLWKIEKTRI